MHGTPDKGLAFKLLGLCAAMFAFGFALVPLYDVFCTLTGLGGKTAEAAQTVVVAPDPSRLIRVEFLGSVASGTPFEFHPDVSHLEVHPGQLYEANFYARNLTSKPLVAQAVPSVAPGTAAKHFRKTECFCFTAQAFEPSEARELKVVFSVAPELPEYVDTVTLAYTFFTAAE